MAKSKNKLLVTVLAFLVSISIMFGFLSGLNRVDAKTVSEADAVSWMNSVKGKTLDYDGAYGGQCVDFFNYYLRDVFGINPWPTWQVSYAYQLWDCPAPEGFSKIAGNSSFKVGDIVIWNKGNGSTTGHVGVVYSTNGTTQIMQQNYNSQQYVTVNAIHWTNLIRGVFRPTFTEPTPIASPGTQTIKNGRYHIISQMDDNLNVTVEGVSQENSANVQLWHDRLNPKQTWDVKWLGNGYYSLINTNSGKALDVKGGNAAVGTNVQQYENHTYDAQQWVIRANADSSYSLIAKWGGYTLDAVDGKTADGTNLRMWYDNGSSAQKFYFVEYAGKTIADGRYYIAAKSNPNEILSVENQSKEMGANVELYNKEKRLEQAWDVKHVGDGIYTITNVVSSMSLDVDGFNPANAVNVKQWEHYGPNSQRWIIKPYGDGSYRIISKCGGRCLDMTGGTIEDGTNVQMYNRNDTDAQKWVFTEYVEPEMTATLSSSKGTRILPKTNTNLKVNVKYGKGAYTYKFIVYNETTDKWYKIQDFSDKAEATWNSGPVGKKTLYADIKDEAGIVKRISLGVRVEESTLKVDSFTSSEGTKLPAKSYTTLTATASGGSLLSVYQYKFIVYNETTKQWYKIKDFNELGNLVSGSNSCQWYTGPVGKKVLYVDVKDTQGTVVRSGLSVTVS